MDRYNFNTIEKKWQKFWDENQTYKTSIDKKKKEVLRPRDVSLPIWKNTHGTCKKLYDWRYISTL